MKKPLKDSFIIGFALFSMFFGAGNVIFPPYLGLESGPHWLLGFISYYIADIGLALLAMFAILRQGSPEKVTSRIGKVPSVLLMCAIVLCIGPMLAIPRTAATTFETSVTPLVSGVSPVLFSVLFFLLILLLCVRERAVAAVLRCQTWARKEAKYSARITEKADGHCTVRCTVKGLDSELFCLELGAPDRLSAELVKKQFILKGNEIYQLLINKLTEGGTRAALPSSVL